MSCEKCGKEAAVLINGWCVHCKPFRRCPSPSCGKGTLRHSGTPNWMNRHTCDVCKKHFSR
ncbi:MAG TPA: hypothetical protein VEI97_08195 [bacterium]|nr:hypothetical protein [bacterium]